MILVVMMWLPLQPQSPQCVLDNSRPHLCAVFMTVLCSDPQEDLSGPEKRQTHTDWLTLNVGGRCFTTTR